MSDVFHATNEELAAIIDGVVYIWGYAPDLDTRPYAPESGRTLSVPGVAYYRPETGDVFASDPGRTVEFVTSLPFGAAIVIPTMEGDTRKGEERWLRTPGGWVCNPE